MHVVLGLLDVRDALRDRVVEVSALARQGIDLGVEGLYVIYVYMYIRLYVCVYIHIYIYT